MRKTTILCDNCKSDLSQCGPVERYMIELRAIPIPFVGLAVVDVMMLPPIEEDLYFCGLGCLRNWVKNNVCVEEGI